MFVADAESEADITADAADSDPAEEADLVENTEQTAAVKVDEDTNNEPQRSHQPASLFWGNNCHVFKEIYIR